MINTARHKAEKIMSEASAQAERITADGRKKIAAHVADIEKRGES